MNSLIGELTELMKDSNKILLTSFLFLMPKEFNKIHSEFIKKNININDISEDGIESNPHISLLLFVEQYKSIITQSIFHKLPFEIKMGELKYFNNEKYDCLYIGIDDKKSQKILNECYDIMSESSTKSHTDYANNEYIPHCTVAYLKKGNGQKYVDMYKSYFTNINVLIKNFSIDKEVFDIVKIEQKDFS